MRIITLDLEPNGYFVKHGTDYYKTYDGEIYQDFRDRKYSNFNIREIFAKIYDVTINREGVHVITELESLNCIEGVISSLKSIDQIVGYNILFDVFVLACYIFHNSKSSNELSEEIVSTLMSCTCIDLQRWSYKYNPRGNFFMSLDKLYSVLTGRKVDVKKLHTAKYDTELTWDLYEHMYEHDIPMFETKFKILL